MSVVKPTLSRFNFFQIIGWLSDDFYYLLQSVIENVNSLYSASTYLQHEKGFFNLSHSLLKRIDHAIVGEEQDTILIRVVSKYAETLTFKLRLKRSQSHGY